MTALSELTCEACSANAKLLTKNEIDSLLLEISDWEVIVDSDIQKLKREFQTKNYQQSISFTNAVAILAESINHHPQIIVEYSSVTVIWWSHNIKGLHKNDFIMAAKTSDIF
ncbi:MAG: 4a-hydroxytetrahydrobiopterin dehydratase [Colwellia sp.]|nr:4a-hydroxytetrahydrobiopterin dehydratase [Colwellia sp.]